MNKDELIDNYVYELMMPYIIYLRTLLSDKKIYKRLKKKKSKEVEVEAEEVETEKLNLYLLMEIIKKKIEGLND